jgi:hypothetical protein
MGKYRTFEQVEEEYYCEHPEEIDSFLTVTFEEYAKDNDTGALLSALSMRCTQVRWLAANYFPIRRLIT